MTERWRTALFSRCSADALVAERRTGHPLIESDGRRSIECVTPDHIYEVVFIEFRLTTGSVRPVRLRNATSCPCRRAAAASTIRCAVR